MEKEIAQELIDFIYDSPCNFLATQNIKKELLSNGFTELRSGDSWQIEKNKTFIAKELGTVREVISRVFKSIEKQGIIKADANMKIQILDVLALEKEFTK